MTYEVIFQVDKDIIREGLSKYTRKAFQVLPKLDKPCILDIGCGSGVPTMELAKLSNGQIIGLDNNQLLLDSLTAKIQRAELSDRVKTVKCSMFDMEFPDENFDIIWAEGSISVIGFERGLKEWKRFLKPTGFLVVHDEMGNVTEKLEQVSDCSYELLEYFVLDEDTWWHEYFAPLEKKAYEMRRKNVSGLKVITALNEIQWEIDEFKKNPKRYASVFFIMKRQVEPRLQRVKLDG